jgi:hypothetical protein
LPPVVTTNLARLFRELATQVLIDFQQAVFRQRDKVLGIVDGKQNPLRNGRVR